MFTPSPCSALVRTSTSRQRTRRPRRKAPLQKRRRLLAEALEDRRLLAPVVINGAEVWDGVANPHAADGVVLSGSAPNFTYTIPNGMTINAAGSIGLGTVNNNVTLAFTPGAGGLALNGAINVNSGFRDFVSPVRTFTLALNDNSMTGTGDVAVTNNGQNRHTLSITGTGNVAFDDINFLSADAGNSGDVNIAVSGSVTLDQVNTSDNNAGGNAAKNVTIRGSSVTVGSVLAYAARTGSPADNGNVTLEALAPPAFSPANAAGNWIGNVLTVNGPIDVEGSGLNQGGGNVTLRGVKIVIGSGFSIDQEGDSTRTIEAGAAKLGYPTGLLFMNGSATPLTASHTVQWTPPTSVLGTAMEPFDTAASAAGHGWVAVDGDGPTNTDGGVDLQAGWSNTELANSELAGDQSGERGCGSAGGPTRT